MSNKTFAFYVHHGSCVFQWCILITSFGIAYSGGAFLVTHFLVLRLGPLFSDIIGPAFQIPPFQRPPLLPL